jgi:hypothetical protein
VALAVLAPCLAYPFVTAAAVAGGAAWIAAALRADRGTAGGRPGDGLVLVLPPVVMASLVLLPLAWMLYDGMGAAALPGVSVLVAFVLLGLLPAAATASRRARASLLVAGGATALAGALAVVVLPPFTRAQPRPASLVLFHDVEERNSRWLIATAGGRPPPALASHGFAGPETPYPWAPEATAWAAPAAVPPPEPPVLADLAVERSAGELRVRSRLTTAGGSPWAGVIAPAGRWLAATVDGTDAQVPVSETANADEGWQAVEHVTLPAAGAQLELRFRGEEPVELWLWDGSPGVGAAGEPLLRARPEWAVPIHRGDRTLVARRLVIGPPAHQ